MAAQDHLSQGQFYHGTTREGLTEIAPATAHRQGVVFPHDTDRSFAYATPDESNAWSYAEKAWHSSGTGIPRVYQVEPTGSVESDPIEGPHGRRGNFETDVRSRQSFRVVNEIQMPEHMGDPDDWR